MRNLNLYDISKKDKVFLGVLNPKYFFIIANRSKTAVKNMKTQM